jgi:alcohol dehydrogenase class IV
METFEYNANPARVIFGSGTLQKLPDEVKRLSISSPILLSTPRGKDQTETLKQILSDSVKNVSVFAGAKMHTPTYVTDEALAYARAEGADGIISIGGGSTIGLGKAISIRTGLPHICIPTTYSGSEMTPVLGETADGRKTTRSDPKILPGTVIYDVDLTMSLPPQMSATSGVNAIAHAGMRLVERFTGVMSTADISLSVSGSSLCREDKPSD